MLHGVKIKSREEVTQVYQDYITAHLLTLPGTHQHRAQERLRIIL